MGLVVRNTVIEVEVVVIYRYIFRDRGQHYNRLDSDHKEQLVWCLECVYWVV